MMDVSRQDAENALADVQGTIELTRRALADGGASILLMLWGAIWVVGFLTSHFQAQLGGWAWAALDTVGLVVSFIVIRRSPVKSPADRRIGLFWLLLFAYAVLWLMVIAAASPRSVTVTGEQLGAFICSVVMFGYVVMGLWLRSALLFWLGLGVTVVTIAGLFLLQAQFHLLMAVLGGGALIGAGVYVRRRWR